jgi:hypothetical protein
VDLFARGDFTETVAPERCFIDLYVFLDILGTRGITVRRADADVLRGILRGLRSAGLPAALLARLARLAARAGVTE